MNITAWDHRARRIVGRDLRKGDRVFDAHGGTHALRRVRATRKGVVKFLREDSPNVETIGNDEPITVIPRTSAL